MLAPSVEGKKKKQNFFNCIFEVLNIKAEITCMVGWKQIVNY